MRPDERLELAEIDDSRRLAFRVALDLNGATQSWRQSGKFLQQLLFGEYPAFFAGVNAIVRTSCLREARSMTILFAREGFVQPILLFHAKGPGKPPAGVTVFPHPV